MFKEKVRIFASSHGWLMLILIGGLLMRLQNITQPFVDVFSWRQTSTAMMAENFFKVDWNILYPQVSWNGPGPGYQGREFQTVSYLAALAYAVFGQYDIIGRIIPIIFGMWGIFALYQLILLVWGRQHAIAGAAMMAILPGAAFTDRSFLPDPAMVSLTTTCMWLFVLYLFQQKNRHLILAALAGCLGILSKIPGLIIALPMLYALIIVFDNRKQLKLTNLKPVLIAAILVLIPVIAYYLWARYLSLNYPPYHFAGSGNWIWNEPKQFISSHYFLRNVKDIFQYWLLGLPAMSLLILGLLFPPPRLAAKFSPIGIPWFFHYLLAGCAFYYLIGAQELVKNPWNFHLFLPVIAVFCGRFLVVIYNIQPFSKRLAKIRIALLIIFMLAFNVKLMKGYLFRDRDAIDTYRMGMALSKLVKPGDLVITIAYDIGDPLAIYYSGAKGWVFPPADQWAPIELPDDDSESIRSLQELRKKGGDWFGIADIHYTDIQQNHPLFASYLNTNLTAVSQTKDFVILNWK